MKKTILLGLLSSGLLFSQASNAGEWAIGGLVGQANADEACEGVFNCDDSDTALGIYLSYDFNNTWGTEFGYMDLGSYSGDVAVSNFGTFNISADASVIYFAATGTVNFNDNWSLTGRLGLADGESETSVAGFGEVTSTSSTEALLGASLNYNFNDNLQAQLRYDNFGGDIDSLALGLKYSFGK